jgi:uncharacterized protein (DUF2249 family)
MNIARMLAKATRPLRDGQTARHPADAPAVEVDVREDLRTGKEPFSRIMGAVEELRPDQVLRVRAIFEPVPLFRVLGKKGFAYETEEHAPDDWSIWFWRPAAEQRSAGDAWRAGDAFEALAQPGVEPTPHAQGDTIWLDVRGLKPPEPLTRTLAALDTLPAGRTLVQIHNRIPQLLFPLLVERGFACEVDERDPERILIRIWRAQ